MITCAPDVQLKFVHIHEAFEGSLRMPTEILCITKCYGSRSPYKTHLAIATAPKLLWFLETLIN